MTKLGSRRQINFQFNTKDFTHNLNILAKTELKKVAHDGTLAYLLKRSAPEETSYVRVQMVNRLIRTRCLEKFRLDRYYLIAFDGTGHLVYKERHCKHCLVLEKGRESFILLP